MSNRRVLVCDDDNMVLRSILRLLTHAGYEADGCTTRAEARRRLSATPYQAVVIDRGFPDGDGLEICRELRARRDHTPVLFVSAHGEDEDIVEGLEAGADDYIVKPIAWPVLRARMAAVLRRSSPPGTITAGAFTIDPLRHLATVRFPDEEPLEVSLSGVELRLLACLARTPERAVARDRLVEAIWGLEAGVSDNALDVVVLRLRRKLGRYAHCLAVVRGHGFVLRAWPEPARATS